MPSTIHIKNLSTREAILDALHRALRSYDTDDIPLHDSAFFPSDTTTFTLGTMGTYTGLSQIRGVLHNVGDLDTTHIVSTVRIEEGEDGKSAKLTATGMNQHCRPGEGVNPDGAKFLTGARYDCDLERDEKDGLWKFTRFGMEIVWTQGDGRVLQKGGDEKEG